MKPINKKEAEIIRKLLNLSLAGLLMFSVGCLIGGYTEPQHIALAEPIQPVTVQIKAVEPEQLYIGEFTITGYCACSTCCGKWAGGNTASGTIPTAGRTVGADWDMLPAGTDIYIEGIGLRTVEDKPANWIIKKYDGKIIDVFCATHAEALAVGRQVVKVYKE